MSIRYSLAAAAELRQQPHDYIHNELTTKAESDLVLQRNDEGYFSQYQNEEFAEVFTKMNLWDPALAHGTLNPTNDPLHATQFAWANREPMMLPCRKQGLRDDQSWALRQVPNVSGPPPDRRLEYCDKIFLHPEMPPCGLSHVPGVVPGIY